MRTFDTSRDAKEFIVSRIVMEAQRHHVPLSEVETKMLYFSETARTLPDIREVNEAFDRDYDRVEYEQKITRLIRELCANALEHNRGDFESWTEAVRVIRGEDHYLLVMISAANASGRTTCSRDRRSILRRWANPARTTVNSRS